VGTFGRELRRNCATRQHTTLTTTAGVVTLSREGQI